MKEQNISYELGCSENCALPHNTRRHGEVPARRLKTQVSEYLGQDDYLWEDALGVSGKLEMLEESIKKLRE